MILLLLLVAVLAAACLILSNLNKDNDTQTVNESETLVIAQIDADSVTGFSYDYQGETLAFTNSSGYWSYDADGEFPVTQNTVTTMISDISSIEAIRELSDPEDASSYGFDDPTLVVDIFCGGETVTFEVGDVNSYSGAYYLRHNGVIYTCDELLVSTFSKDLFDYLTTTDLPTLDTITAFSVDGKEITDESAVADLSQSYAAVTRGDVADYTSKESYGFDGTEHPVEVKYSVDNSVTDSNGNAISTVETEYTYTFSYAYVGETAYIMLQDDDLIYEVTGVSAFDVIEEETAE